MNQLTFADSQTSSMAHGHPMPTAGELHVWYWTASAMTEDAIQLLDDDERGRCDRFATSELRQCFLASHAGLRQILAGYLNTPASELGFLQTPAGKPYLANTPLQFNLSHSRDVNLLAVGMDAIGVDIERVRTVTSLSSLAARHFARPELESMRRADDPQREFFCTWTRKEAIIKLVGLGLSAGVQDLDTSRLHEGIAVPPVWECPANRCWLADIAIDPDHAAAVAIRDKPHTIRLFRTG